MQKRLIRSDRQSLRGAAKRKIANTPTSEKIPKLYPHRALNRVNMVGCWSGGVGNLNELLSLNSIGFHTYFETATLGSPLAIIGHYIHSLGGHCSSTISAEARQAIYIPGMSFSELQVNLDMTDHYTMDFRI